MSASQMTITMLTRGQHLKEFRNGALEKDAENKSTVMCIYSFNCYVESRATLKYKKLYYFCPWTDP